MVGQQGEILPRTTASCSVGEGVHSSPWFAAERSTLYLGGTGVQACTEVAWNKWASRGRRKCSVCAVQLQSTGKSFEFFPIWMFALVLLMLNRFLVLISYSLCGGRRETREEDEK